MRYSVALPHPTSGPEFTDPDVLAAIACEIEDCRLDACAIMDHPFPLLEHPRAGGQAFDLFALGGFLAAATKRLTVHFNLVVMGYRNPFLVARCVSTLDHLARGRVIVGIGAGYMRAEFDALGADFARRGALVDEGVAAMKAAWSGEPVTLDSVDWQARGNSMFPRPFSDPHPKLFRGGNTKQAIESAVRNFDGWHPFEAESGLAREARTAAIASFDDLRRRVGLLRELEERLERPTPVEIALDRPDATWLQAGRDAVREQIEELEELGVTSIGLYLPGASAAEVVENVRAVADVVPAS